MNELMDKYLKKRIEQPTVILSFRILVDNVIENGPDHKMSKCDIESIFNSERRMFGVQTFRRDYVMRQSGNRNNAIDQIDEEFFIRPEYLEGLSLIDLREISDSINEYYREIYISRMVFLEEIESYKEKGTREKYDFILNLLEERETERKGQAFEVSGFAILKAFYECRGFELNRFSTVYSNDGGVDYSGQNAIYQVAVVMTNKKFEEDIEKAPMKKRIMVYRRASGNFDYSLFENELIADHLNLEELKDHLRYLEQKGGGKNLHRVIDVIIEEFQREFYQNIV